MSKGTGSSDCPIATRKIFKFLPLRINLRQNYQGLVVIKKKLDQEGIYIYESGFIEDKLLQSGFIDSINLLVYKYCQSV